MLYSRSVFYFKPILRLQPDKMPCLLKMGPAWKNNIQFQEPKTNSHGKTVCFTAAFSQEQIIPKPAKITLFKGTPGQLTPASALVPMTQDKHFLDLARQWQQMPNEETGLPLPLKTPREAPKNAACIIIKIPTAQKGAGGRHLRTLRRLHNRNQRKMISIRGTRELPLAGFPACFSPPQMRRGNQEQVIFHPLPFPRIGKRGFRPPR